MSMAFVIRYETHPAHAETNRQLVEQVFAELNTEDPGGLRYACFCDGVHFMHVALVEGEQNPIEDSAAFKEFQAGIGERLVGPPERTEVQLVGSYGWSLPATATLSGKG